MISETPEQAAAREISAILDKHNVGLVGAILGSEREVAMRRLSPDAQPGLAQLEKNENFSLNDAGRALRHVARAGSALNTLTKEIAGQYAIMRKLVEAAGYQCRIHPDAGPDAFITLEPCGAAAGVKNYVN